MKQWKTYFKLQKKNVLLEVTSPYSHSMQLEISVLLVCVALSNPRRTDTLRTHHRKNVEKYAHLHNLCAYEGCQTHIRMNYSDFATAYIIVLQGSILKIAFSSLSCIRMWIFDWMIGLQQQWNTSTQTVILNVILISPILDKIGEFFFST